MATLLHHTFAGLPILEFDFRSEDGRLEEPEPRHCPTCTKLIDPKHYFGVYVTTIAYVPYCTRVCAVQHQH